MSPKGALLTGNLTRVGIVGFGVRALTVLERLVAAARARRLQNLVVDVFDSGTKPNYGEGLPDYLLLNIMCGQTSSFPDPVSVRHFPATPGPSLFEWARDQGLGFQDDAITVVPGGVGEITPQSFLPRRLMGKYIEGSYSRLVSELPTDIAVHRRQAIVSDVEELATGFRVKVGDDAHDFDYLFLTIGGYSKLTPGDVGLVDKSGEHPRRQAITPVLPLPESVADIGAEDVVAVAGMGLSGIDVVASLTLGRGGSFVRDGWHSTYEPSGREPRIVLYSRSGLPYRSRPRVPRAKPYTPLLFTHQRISHLASQRLGTLEFDSEILPWLLAELALAFATKSGLDLPPDMKDRLSALSDPTEALLKVGSLSPVPFDARAEYFGGLESWWPDAMSGSDAYQRAVTRFIERDLAEAWAGTEESPMKYALELARDLRDVLRAGVDRFVLTPESHAAFFGQHRSLIDRIVVGPQLERSADLVALMRAGIVAASLGPDPSIGPGRSRAWSLRSTLLAQPEEVEVDWLVESHAQGDDRDPATRLMAQLFRTGFLAVEPRSPVANAVAMDSLGHPLGEGGTYVGRCWLLGLASEGSTYYNNYVMSPDKYVKGFADADAAVWELATDMSV